MNSQMLLKLNIRFINFFNHHITEASTVHVHKNAAYIRRFGSPTYVAITYQICKDHYYIRPDVLKKI